MDNTEQLDKVIARRGTYIVNNTVEATKKIAGILVLEDTVISSLKQGGIEVKALYVAAPATAIKAGAYITAIGEDFSGITLTSGSVSLVLA